MQALQQLRRHGVSAALAGLQDRYSAGELAPLSWAQCLLRLGSAAAAAHPEAALGVLAPLLGAPVPPVAAVLLAGLLYDKLGRRTDALAAVRAVVAAPQASPLQVLQAANLLVRLGEQGLALASAVRAFEAMGRPLEHAGTLLYIAQVTAQWPLVEQLTAQLRAGHASGLTERLNEGPRTHVLWCDDEAVNLRVLGHWSRQQVRAPQVVPPQARPPRGRRLRVGYLSSDFREHPTARLVLGVLRHHNRQAVELFMYCSGWDDGSPLRKAVVAQFEHVHAVAALSDEAAAALMRSHQIDVLVELNGPTRAHRMGILGHRPAPVQVAYLGWPGSVGGRVVDYVVGDAHTVPEGAEQHYPEKVIRLHPTYQANDHAAQPRAPQPTRRAVGLPDDPSLVILGMFNAINKVHQVVWDAWMQILRAAPHTLLWMLDPGAVARQAIAHAAEAAGVAVSRIIAAPKLPQAAHLARLQCCDLMLDPWPYGGHTSTADALFAGVPVLALEGNNFASRVSPGLLRAAGLHDLVCRTPEAYVSRAWRLLHHPGELRALQDQLRNAVPNSPVFDSAARARQLEQAFRVAVERVAQGLPPTHIHAHAADGAVPMACDQRVAAERSNLLAEPGHGVRQVSGARQPRGIPKVIHQTAHDAGSLAPEIQRNIEHLKALNPGWTYRFYSDVDAAEFIQANYGPRYLDAWKSISPLYGAARADLFRYLLVYHSGGVYLDIKSSASRPLDEVLRADDSFILSHWKNAPGERYAGWGMRPALHFSSRGEYQQWFVAASPRHPFLAAVIDRVIENISNYRFGTNGVGKKATLAVTGPVAYTQAIFPILDKGLHRVACAEQDLGLIYSIYEGEGLRAHEARFQNHYAKQTGPLVVHEPQRNAMKVTRVQAVNTERFPPVRTLMVDGIRYRFEHQVGVGAFSTVYKARDEWGQSLAVKVYPPAAKPAVWENEVRQLRRFAGPAVVCLHRVFVHEGSTYLVLDDAGIPVSRCHFDSEAARMKAALCIARGVLQALSRLHAAQHCHGDISPQNVLLRLDAQSRLHSVSLVDFGLCRSQAALDAGERLMAHWTPPPEYLRQRPLQAAALDIWHVGVLLLQVVKGETLDYSEADVLSGQPLRDAEAVPGPMSRALALALTPDPAQRPDALGLWRAMRGLP